MEQQEFEVTGVSRSGRVRKKSSKLFDFQSPDEVERRRVYKRSVSRNPIKKYAGRGRPSLAALKARRAAAEGRDDANDMAPDDDDADVDNETSGLPTPEPPAINTDDENMDEVLANDSDTDDDGFGELVADVVGTEGASIDRSSRKPDSKVRKSLYMTEKRLGKDGRVERKDKGKARYTAYSLWAREYRKSSKYIKEVDFTTARRELWANVSNKEKNNWRRKAKIQANKAKAMEKSGFNSDSKNQSQPAAPNANSTFINRPTTSRTKKLAEDKQKAAKDDVVGTKSSNTTPRKTRNNSYNRRSATSSAQNPTKTGKNALTLYAATNGSTSNYNNILGNSTICNINTPLTNIEPIDVAAHLKLLGESLSVIGTHLKEHEGQIAVPGSLSVLLDSILCSLAALSCLTTYVPGMEKKPKLRANLAATLDNIAYVMPGL